MNYQLIALDLDGTLKNHENKITPRTKEALLNAQKKGYKLILASGRPTQGQRNEALELEMNKYGGYILSFNGANVRDYKTNEIIYSKSLDKKEASDIYALASSLKLAYMVYDELTIITDAFGEKDQYVIGEKKNLTFDLKVVDHIVDNLPEVIEKVLLTGDPEYLIKCETIFKEHFPTLSIYRSAPFFLEVMSNGINKGSSLKYLLDKLGIDKEQLVAFGDGFNDASMIKLAGLGIAMGNAVDDVKAIADITTDDNCNDGIAKIIERCLL